jgi:hypothetical protein
MIDEPGRNPPRFPDSARDKARDAIRAAIEQEVRRTTGLVIAVASGAHGGDLLFHDICDELKIPHRLLLPLPPDTFRNESVAPAGPFWQDLFDRLLTVYPDPPALAKTSELPLWLSTRSTYTPWQRANLWLIEEALALEAQHFTLLALWDGVDTHGMGGTAHMRKVAQQYGAALVTVPTADLVKVDSAQAAG